MSEAGSVRWGQAVVNERGRGTSQEGRVSREAAE